MDMTYRKKVKDAGDNFYLRRGMILEKSFEQDYVCFAISLLPKPKSVLEIGCADGWRLNQLEKRYECKCQGIDASPVALQIGRCKYPVLGLQDGFADSLPYEDNEFDLVIFGHVLYCCNNLFKVASEGDRVLKNDGYMVIFDFYPEVPHYNVSVDDKTLCTYKMDYSKMYSWHPDYTIVHRNIFVEKDNLAGDKLEVVVLKKLTR